MSTTVLDNVTITNSGGTVTGTCGIDGGTAQVVFEITDFDGNSSNLDIELTKGATAASRTLRDLQTTRSVTGIDASTNGATVVVGGDLNGLELLEVQVTNNAASDTTITMIENTSG